MFCDDRINVQKQEWSDIQAYLDSEPYRLPKNQPDPQNRPLSKVGMPQLCGFLKEQDASKKSTSKKAKQPT
jgi:hypothetical protein